MPYCPSRTVVAGVAGVVVVTAWPRPGAWSAAFAGLRGTAPAPTLDTFAALAAGAALWALAGWVLLALTAGRLAAVPGLVGAVGHTVVRLAVPRALHGVVLRGIVTGGVAGGLLLGPAAAAVASPAWPAPAGAVAIAAADPGPAWPTSPPAPTTAVPTAPGSAPAPGTTTPTTPGPTTPGPTAAATTSPSPDPSTPGATTPGPTVPGPAWPTPGPSATTSVPTTPSAPATPTTPTAPTAPTPPPGTAGPGEVVVTPGDSLWSIAAADLRAHGTTPTDAAVAAAWPVWFAVNRAVVGPDPGLLHPGTHLTAPPATPTAPTATPTPTDGGTS